METNTEKILSKYTPEEREEILKSITGCIQKKEKLERSNAEIDKVLNEVMEIYGHKSTPVENGKSDTDKTIDAWSKDNLK